MSNLVERKIGNDINVENLQKLSLKSSNYNSTLNEKVNVVDIYVNPKDFYGKGDYNIINLKGFLINLNNKNVVLTCFHCFSNNLQIINPQIVFKDKLYDSELLFYSEELDLMLLRPLFNLKDKIININDFNSMIDFNIGDKLKLFKKDIICTFKGIVSSSLIDLHFYHTGILVPYLNITPTQLSRIRKEYYSR